MRKKAGSKQTIKDYIRNAFAGLLMLAFFGMAAFVGYIFLTSRGIDVTDSLDIPDIITKLSVDCDGMLKVIEAGERCEASNDCLMTGSEFEEFNEAKRIYVRDCGTR
ncbi:MAG: hypothetical protein U5K76_12740 [Woeseiaceae bacterium]|nr:hypothetical protein [Woeseiaceae bacterium]